MNLDSTQLWFNALKTGETNIIWVDEKKRYCQMTNLYEGYKSWCSNNLPSSRISTSAEMSKKLRKYIGKTTTKRINGDVKTVFVLDMEGNYTC